MTSWLEDANGQPLCSDCGKGLDDEAGVTLVRKGDEIVPVCDACWQLRFDATVAAELEEL